MRARARANADSPVYVRLERAYCYGRISRADESPDIHEYIGLFKAEPRRSRAQSGIHDTPAANGKAIECAINSAPWFHYVLREFTLMSYYRAC